MSTPYAIFAEAAAIANATAVAGDKVMMYDDSAGTVNIMTFTQLADLMRTAGNAARLVATGAATLSITAALHDKRIIKADQAAGVDYTLPAATGSGMEVEIVITTVPTSNDITVKVADADDEMQGYAIVENDTDGSTSSFFAADDDDTITLNRTTTGGTKLGERIVCTDIASNVWQVRCYLAATGTEATPFSATVS